jgi:hypothetical protein
VSYSLLVLYYFYASEDPHCTSIRRRGPGDADGMVMTIILAFGEDTLASREDIQAPLGMGSLSYGTNNNYLEPAATGV